MIDAVIEREEQEQAVAPPEFPRYFKPCLPWRMRAADRTCDVVCMRYDNPQGAIYHEGGAWSEQCDCGTCTLADTLEQVARGRLMEITAVEALLLIGSGGAL